MVWLKVPLGEVIRHRKEFIEISPDVSYARCRVQTAARGIVLRDRITGSQIKTKRQKVCRAGEFLVAEIDAKLGGYGIVPIELEGAIVSSHYFLYELNEEKIHRRYLHWYSKTDNFLHQINARGSTNYAAIRSSNVLDYLIPLPPIEEQRRIVERFDRLAALIDERRKVIDTAEADMQNLLSKAFERAVEGAPRRQMNEVSPLVRRPVEVEAHESYPELGVRSFGRGTFHKPPLQGIDLTWQKLFRIEDGDLVFSNIKAWEGAFAVAEPKDHGRVGSHRYLTCVPIDGTASAPFLWYYLQTREGLRKIQEGSPGSADRNRTLGQARLSAIHVPVPSIEVQRWFDRIQDKVRQVRRIRAATAGEIDALSKAMLTQVFRCNEQRSV